MAGLAESQVAVYPTLAGGGYGRKLETRAIEQAAMIAVRTKRPVQLSWSRLEESVQDGFRAPARAQILGTPGEVAWGGQASTAFWIDPAEDLSVVLMTKLVPSSALPIRSVAARPRNRISDVVTMIVNKVENITPATLFRSRRRDWLKIIAVVYPGRYPLWRTL